MKSKITGIIIAKNESEKIGDALKSLDWVDKLMLIDTGSVDKTINIAKKHDAEIHIIKLGSFSDWRNLGLQKAKTKWVLYLDADERVTPLLRREIKEVTKQPDALNAYAIPRRNYILGREFKHGGEWPDYQIRLLNKSGAGPWTGDVHERPKVDGEVGHLEEPMIHLKHDNFEDMVKKTNKWSDIEANLIYNSGHPKMVPWRFLRIMLTEAFDRLIKKQGFRDGKEGIIYSLYQVWSRFITYAKLWELQIKSGDSDMTK